MDHRPLSLEPVTHESWAPFGTIPSDEQTDHDTTDLEFLWNDGHVNFIGHTNDELTFTTGGAAHCELLNRHDTHTQTLMPMSGDAYVVVAPEDHDFSSPGHFDHVHAFYLPQHAVVHLTRGTWHWGPYPLDSERVRIFNIQGRGYAKDNGIAWLARDHGVTFDVQRVRPTAPAPHNYAGDTFDRNVAIVTGAGSGIGEAIAHLLAARGVQVGVLDRNEEAAARVAGSIAGAVPVACDVRDADGVAAAVDTVASELGPVSILVNNAGIGDLRPLHTLDDKLWHRLVDVNLTGTFNATRAVVPPMLELGRGVIVNNASLSGSMPTRNEAAYSAAKAGVIALTKSTALEYGPAIRANCVAPGFVATPLTSVFQDVPHVFEPIRQSIPLQRMGSADEVAEVIAFCSDRASYVTGQTITVDGGSGLPQAGTDAALIALYEHFSS